MPQSFAKLKAGETCGQGINAEDSGGCGVVSIVTSENEFCKNPMSKDTITTIYSESYDAIGGHKHSLDQEKAPG